MTDPYPFLITIPHGGFLVPDEVIDLIALGPEELRYYSDPAVDEIYDFGSKVSENLGTSVSRMVVDLNRPPYHLAPKYPDGVVKSQTGHKIPVWKEGKFPGIATIHHLLVNHYFPFQEKADRLIDEKDIQVAFDCHSMLPFGLPSQPDAGKKRPAICLSNNGDTAGKERPGVLATCSGDLMRVLGEHFMEQFSVDGDVLFNTPFGGGFISIAHHWHRATPWVQIEVNRALYEVQTGNPGVPGLIDRERVSDLNNRVWTAIAGFWDDVGEKTER
ncbi:MAG TPA: N-formylglutamate amidohydrolase [Methanoregulaceae archaeon]|nr:N-formylglutamate amidohydrolase [Methanoregulaceae archaeon]